ncbi:MAG: hypothetical protein ACI807_003050 [Paracoccaceae bacterium]|jgi:hypothetical protein
MALRLPACPPRRAGKAFVRYANTRPLRVDAAALSGCNKVAANGAEQRERGKRQWTDIVQTSRWSSSAAARAV